MSLDVYLEGPNRPFALGDERILIREDGETRLISRDEWDRRFPDRIPVTVTSDDYDRELYWGNITHNLGKMASAAGIYQHLWRPEELGITMARELIAPLSEGLEKLRAAPDTYRQHDAPNGWGTYDGFVRFVDEYLTACKAFPSATIRISR